MLFVNPTALDWADAKGESLGTKGGFQLGSQKKADTGRDAGSSGTSALSLEPRGPSQGRPCLGGALPVVPVSGFLGTPEPAGPRSHALRSLVPARPGCGTGNVGTRAGAAPRARLPVCYPCSSWDWRVSHVPLEWQQHLEPLAAFASEFC